MPTYGGLVDERSLDSDSPLRYTDLEYHNDTVHKFAENVRLIEDNFHQDPANRYFDSIKVYRRNKDIFDIEEFLFYYFKQYPEEQIFYHNIFYSANQLSTIIEIMKKNKELVSHHFINNII